MLVDFRSRITIQHGFWHMYVRLSRRWHGWRAAQTLTLTATRTSSTSNATMTVCGWTTIGRNPTTSGIRTTSLCSVSETIFFPRPYRLRFLLSGLSNFFFQPPSILPVSSSFRPIISQCLLEIILPSHSTEIRNFNVSKTKMHSETFPSLFSFVVKYVMYVSSSKSKNLFSIRVPMV